MLSIPEKTVAIELKCPRQTPVFISLSSIVSISPGVLWESPSLEIELFNGKKHSISFTSEQARTTFYDEITTHFHLISHQIKNLATNQ